MNSHGQVIGIDTAASTNYQFGGNGNGGFGGNGDGGFGGQGGFGGSGSWLLGIVQLG